jgi:replicative DNA helicase
MLDLSNKKLQIDTIMLREHLNNKNLLNDVGGLSYILEIQEDMPPSGMIVQYADIVISKYMIREFLIITSSAFTEGRKSDESFKELLDTTQQRLLDLSQRQISKG